MSSQHWASLFPELSVLLWVRSSRVSCAGMESSAALEGQSQEGLALGGGSSKGKAGRPSKVHLETWVLLSLTSFVNFRATLTPQD